MEPRLILAVETSNASAGGAGVAIGEAVAGGGARVLGAEPLAPPSRHDDDLMPAIDRLARRLGVVPAQFVRVVVSLGPGGYTGLRIGIAAAKMIAEATGAGLVGLPTALAVARRVSAGAARGRLGIALASKGDSTFLTLFEPAGAPAGSGQLVRAGDLAGLALETLVADRFLPPAIAAEAERLGIAVEPPVFDAAAVLEVGAAMPGEDPAGVVPLYPREPDAVRQWRERKG